MAFMMPVVKNDWDIYNSKRGGPGTRSRKVSETKSESGGPGSPPAGGGGSLGSPAHRSVPTMMRAQGSQHGARPPRPARSLSCSPPTPHDKFHTRLVDKLKRTLLRKGRDGSSVDDERSS